MRVAVINTQVPFVRGGAEVLADDLVKQLRIRNISSCLITIPFKWYPNDTLVKHVQACWNIDVSESNANKIDKIICLKFPVYCLTHQFKIIWLCHQHRPVYDMWNNQVGGLVNTEENRKLKSFIKFSDNEALITAKKRFAISKNVSHRLKLHNDIQSDVLYPPISSKITKKDKIEYDKFILCPSRINRLKRQHLIVEAFCSISSDYKLILTGIKEDAEYFTDITKIISKYNRENDVIFLGFISDEKLSSLYRRCNFVTFIPYDEDYGYITIEAMSYMKCVLCTSDSGGVNEFIEHGVNGYKVSPQKESLSAALNTLIHTKDSIKFGKAAYEKYLSLNLCWDNTINKLVS